MLQLNLQILAHICQSSNRSIIADDAGYMVLINLHASRHPMKALPSLESFLNLVLIKAIYKQRLPHLGHTSGRNFYWLANAA